jgi:hypothetical protein
MVNSRLYFSYGERSKSPVVVGLSVVVRPEVEKKLSRVDIALVMQSDVSAPEDVKVAKLANCGNMFIPREISVGVFSEDKQSGVYTLVQSERVKFTTSDRVLACLKDGIPYTHSLYVPYREKLHVSVVAQLIIAGEFDYDDFKYHRFRKGLPVELSCLADSGEESDFNYEEWKDTDWD